jgi:zinc/manganese transport system substrate-binding protein
VHLDPRNVIRIAEALVERMAQLDPANAAWYRERGAAFLGRWRSAIERWEKQAAPLRGASIVVYHKDLSYLIAWLQLNEVGTLEPKPGIPPTPGHLAELVAKMQEQPAKVIVHSAYQDPQPAQFLSQRTRIPVVILPYTVGGTPQAPDLFGLFDDTLARLTGVLR